MRVGAVRFRAAGVLAFSVVMSVGCARSGPPPGSLDAVAALEGLREARASFLGAMAAKDAPAVAAHFADDAVLHVADMPAIRGRVAIGGFYENMFRFLLASEATPGSLRMSSAGEMAFDEGTVMNAFRSEDGPVEYAGKYLLVWEKRDGAWKVVVYAVSSDGSDGTR